MSLLYTRPMDSNAALILLDVDGVLNPQVSSGKLTLDPARAALVHQLSSLGSIVWATSWSAADTYHLANDIGLTGDPAAIAFPSAIQVDRRKPAPTPKLHWVDRWLNRTLIDDVDSTTPVVWIEDRLREDAYAWARVAKRPTLLIKPDAEVGLTAEHVASIREFLNGLADRLPTDETA